MIDMKDWTAQFLTALDACFGDRVWFVGLQGSRGRGEATETSDIDMVVILDELRAADIAAYSDMLDRLPHRELSCGFLGGRGEICGWEPSDLFQLYFDTTPIRGSLDELLPCWMIPPWSGPSVLVLATFIMAVSTTWSTARAKMSCGAVQGRVLRGPGHRLPPDWAVSAAHD